MSETDFETGDRVTETRLAEYMLHEILADYVKSGAGITTDFPNDQITVASGAAYLDDAGSLYYAQPDETTLTLPAPSGTNLVFVAYDPSTDDSATYEIDTDAGNVADPKLQIATVDGAGETVTEENREPDVTLNDATIAALTLAGAMDAGGFDLNDVGEVTADTGTFTDATVVSSPSNANDVAIKEYVDDLFQGVAYQEPVISEQNDPPGSPTAGDRYLIDDAPTGAWVGHANEITEWNGASWDFFAPSEGWVVFIEDEDRLTRYNGTDWVTIASAIDHGSLSGLGDDDHTQYLLVDGTRPMSGDLDLGSNDIINIVNATLSGTLAAPTGDFDTIENSYYNEAAPTTTNASGSTNVDVSAANMREIEVDGDVTISFSNVSTTPEGNNLLLRFYDDDATGPHTITWPESVEWSDGTVRDTVDSDGELIISLASFDGGTTWKAGRFGRNFS